TKLHLFYEQSNVASWANDGRPITQLVRPRDVTIMSAVRTLAADRAASTTGRTQHRQVFGHKVHRWTDCTTCPGPIDLESIGEIMGRLRLPRAGKVSLRPVQRGISLQRCLEALAGA